jgi:hypothetical protein
MTMAVMLSPGMPKTSAGTQAPASAALFELLGSAGHFLADRVTDPGCDIGSRPRQRANNRAQHIAAQLLRPVLHHHPPPASEEITNYGLRRGLDAMGDDKPKDLGHGKEADHRRNEVHASGELGVSESEAGHAGWIVQPNG